MAAYSRRVGPQPSVRYGGLQPSGRPAAVGASTHASSGLYAAYGIQAYMLLMAYKLVCWLRLLLTAYAYVEGLYCGACRPRLYCGVLRCIAACCVLICVFGAGVAAMYCSLLRLYLRGRH